MTIMASGHNKIFDIYWSYQFNSSLNQFCFHLSLLCSANHLSNISMNRQGRETCHAKTLNNKFVQTTIRNQNFLIKHIIFIFNFHDWFIIILHHQDSQQTDRACVKCPSVAGAVIGPEGEYWSLISRDAEPAPLSCHQVSSDIRTVRNKRYLYQT